MKPDNHGSGIVRRKPTGFSLVELLVVVTIVGVLVALLLPAVQAAREAARRLQCANNVKQLAVAALNHESALKFFPTGGWSVQWLGHPDRGFDKRQPGGWVYNILPFIEQQALHDLGASGSGMTIEDGNAQRLATPLGVLNCPSRRPSVLYANTHRMVFNLTSGTLTQFAKADYAMNGGDYMQCYPSPNLPATINAADSFTNWNDNTLMSQQTGICHERSQVKLSDVSDGASNTFLLGEKYVNGNHYTDGNDAGDVATMYCGDYLALLRYTGKLHLVSISSGDNLPRQDTTWVNMDTTQWFGSPHASGLNMSFCDGSVRTIIYAIDGEVYRRLGNRNDGLPLDGSKF